MRKQANLIPYKAEQVQIANMRTGAETINAPSIWTKAKGNRVVAVLDTGCDISHPYLKDKIIGKYNFVYDYNSKGQYVLDHDDVTDNNGHGTHCCGIAVSVAPDVKLLILKVLNYNGSGILYYITEAIRYTVNWVGPNGEKVKAISMSLGSPDDDAGLHNAIIDATKAGVSVVCASGNEGDGSYSTDEYSYPGAYEEVVEVGACDFFGSPAYFSNSNALLDCMAPGVGITSTYKNGGYATLSGTSMATPHVTGALAILSQLTGEVSEMELYNKLVQCTRDLGYSSNLQGHGIVDLSKYKEDGTLKGIIIMESIADLPSAILLQYKFGYPMIEKGFLSSEDLNASVKIKVGGDDKPTADTVLLSGSDRVETNRAVLRYIDTH